MNNFTGLKNKVIDKELCNFCGTCVGICPKGLFEFRNSKINIKPGAEKECTNCNLCYDICPGREVDFPALGNERKNPKNHYYLTGGYEEAFLGKSKNKELIGKCSSGGMATEILIQLFEDKRIDAAAVVGFNKEKPYLPEIIIARNKEELKETSQSKYTIVPMNSILSKIENFKSLAFVGLPCQVHAIRKLQILRHPKAKNIKIILGLFCGNNLYPEAAESLLKRFKTRKEDILSLSYREGEYPGNFSLKLKDGREFKIDKFTFNYLSFFYTVKRCLFCIDQTNEFADISLGDGWNTDFREINNPRTTVIVRDKELLPILEDGRKKNKYVLDKISYQDIIKMHSHTLDNKKSGSLARIKIHEKKQSVPNYNLNKIEIKPSRIIFETLNLGILRLGALGISRKLINKFPLALLKISMLVIRGIWKKKTGGTRKVGNS